MYSATVLDHFHNPRRCGPLAGATHEGTAGLPGDGPYMTLWFHVQNSVVIDAAYKTWGCPAAVACGSVVAELAVGRAPQALLALTERDITALLGGLPEGKEHCPRLAVEAIRRSLGATADV